MGLSFCRPENKASPTISGPAWTFRSRSKQRWAEFGNILGERLHELSNSFCIPPMNSAGSTDVLNRLVGSSHLVMPCQNTKNISRENHKIQQIGVYHRHHVIL